MTTNTRPVVNINAPLGKVDDKGLVRLVSPWIQFFQQFVQKAAAVISVPVGGAGNYTPNQNGTVIITGTGIKLIRGSVTINLTNGQCVIPISIGDEVSWTTASALQFLGS